MVRHGNQQKNGMKVDFRNHKKGVSVPGPAPLTTEGKHDVNENKVTLGEELPNGSTISSNKSSNDDTYQVQDGKKSKKKSKKAQRKDKKVTDETISNQAVPCNSSTEVGESDTPTADASNIKDENEINSKDSFCSAEMKNIGNVPNGLHGEDAVGNVEFPETAIFRFMRTAALSIARASAEWVERRKPAFVSLKANTIKARDHVRMKVQQAQPILLKWIMHIGNIMLLLFMVWLDCTLRGIDSFMRMGTTSFFAIVWCSVLSVTAMIGIGKFLIILAVAAAVGVFLGFTLALLLTGIGGIIFLWFYGSFWTTGFIILLGGLAYILSHDRFALFIISAYSIYCGWSYVGWLGVVLGLNLSFISSDVLLYFLRNMINEQRIPNDSAEQTAGTHSQPSFFHTEPGHASSAETGADLPGERNPGVPSTSGSDTGVTSEDEVIRLLNCTDHYAALGLSKFGNIDASVIKREYRKKAMLVHPDKNMGNEKAAEAFKKLQNAYEVLLDSFKRKEYDDELRREELLNYFRKFQNASPENKGRGFFASTFGHAEAEGEDPMGESRRIACRKCGFFHIWVYTKKQKTRARWCQECNDYHQAKDGDGWVEQSSHPFFFGMLQKVEAPSAYVCAGGKVYDATEWYICQGMRCSVNSHKPTFHVNTSVVSKNSSHAKGTSSGQRGGIPAPNMEETMTEEEFFEWLQNAVQSGAFDNFSSSTSENPANFNSKSSGGNSNTNSANSKKKKKGKKQW